MSDTPKKQSKFVVSVEEGGKEDLPEASEKQYHSSMAAHLKPFELKNAELRKKWIRARGRVKTSVKLNQSSKITNAKKHDLLIEADGHHHSEYAKYMIHPNWKWRKRWDIVTIIFVVYLCWKIPFTLGFEHWYGNKDLKPFETFMDIWFWADIVLNFVTGFVHDGHLVMDPKESAKHYFEFWFWIDIVASIPFDSIVGLFVTGGSATRSKAFRKAIKMVKWMKIPKLFRIGRILKQLKGNKKFFRVFAAMGSLVWLMHFFGCLWIFVLEPCDFDGIYAYPDRPVPAEILYKLKKYQYSLYPEASECSHVWEMYATALDWGAKTILGASPTVLDLDHWSTDIDWEKTGAVHCFGFFASAIGIVLTAFVMGELFVILSHKNPEDWNYFGRLDRIKGEIIKSSIPHDLANDILLYYDYIYMNNKHGKNALLGDIDMPDSLKNRVAVSLHLDLIRKIDLFRKASPACLTQACMYLRLEVFMPDTVVVSADEQSLHVEEIKMYIINRGVLDVIKGAVKRKTKKHDHGHSHGHSHGHGHDSSHVEPEEEEDTILTQLFKGLSFGELNMLDPYRKRQNSVRTRSICELYTMSITDFKLLVESFPAFATIVKKVAKTKNITYSLDHYNLGLHEDIDDNNVSMDEKLEHIDRQVKVICENVRRLTLETK